VAAGWSKLFLCASKTPACESLSKGIGDVKCRRRCYDYIHCLFHYCAPPHRVGALSDDACLTSVAYIGPKSRTERPRKTKIGTEVAHVTRDSDTAFKVKRSKVNLQGAGAYCGGLPHSLFH